MRLHFLSVLIGLMSVVAGTDQTKYPPWPTIPAAAVPTPTPTPATILKADHFYVVQSDTPCILLASPDGRVVINEEAGPVRLRGKFVDGSNKIESRTYSSKQVFIVEGVQQGDVELLKIPLGAKSVADVERRTITVDMGLAPQPPPTPTPTPTPVPFQPAIGIDGTSVLIVYDTTKLTTMTKEQAAIPYAAKTLYPYLDSVCAPHPDGKTKAWRIWDLTVDGTLDSKQFGDAMKRKRDSVPWIIISSKTANYEGPLPADDQATIALIKKTIGG